MRRGFLLSLTVVMAENTFKVGAARCPCVAPLLAIYTDPAVFGGGERPGCYGRSPSLARAAFHSLSMVLAPRVLWLRTCSR